jgi:hypothetical protein
MRLNFVGMKPMVSAMLNGHEVLWDGRTVWVNSGVDGSSIGRFSSGGVDVHFPASVQTETGKQCLACTSSCDRAAWDFFKTKMLEHYGVTIPDAAMPHALSFA